MASSSIASPDKLTNLLILLPTGTFVAFSILVPIITNNGDCHTGEKVATGIIVGLFAFFCAFSTFTDSFVTSDGTIWYGIVTTKGLWNLFFPDDENIAGLEGKLYNGQGNKYKLKLADFYIATLSVISFCTLSLLCTPFTDCFYPGVPSNILKSVPIPVNFFVGLLFAFAPPARHGIGNGVRVTGARSDKSEEPLVSTKSGKDLLEPILPCREGSLQSTDDTDDTSPHLLEPEDSTQPRAKGTVTEGDDSRV